MAEPSIEFGHLPTRGVGFCIDAWGAGPFIIHVDGKTHRFEDSERFGPVKLCSNGSPAHQQWPEKSRFWVAFVAWRKTGRRLAEDGATCIWDEPKPTIARIVRRQITILVAGDEELAGMIDERGRFISRPEVGPDRSALQSKKNATPRIVVTRKGLAVAHG